MATLSVDEINRVGMRPAYAAAEAGGDQFTPGQATLLHIKNAGGGAVTVTVATHPKLVPDLQAVDLAVSVPAGQERLIGPFPKSAFEDLDHRVHVAYSGVSGVTIAALTVPSATATIPIPLNTAPPSIAYDNAVPGETLTALTGTWTTSGPPTFSYQWARCDAAGANGVDIVGATSPTYLLTEADLDSTLRVRVTATDVFGSAAVTTFATGLVHFPSQNIFIDPFLGSVSQVNWSTFSQNAAFYFGGAVASTTAQNSEVTYEFYAEAGVYTLDMLLSNSNNRGVYTIFIDGVQLDTQIDGYSASATIPRATVANIQIPTTGMHTIRLLMATKNAASSGYEGCVSAITLTRAGELA